MDGSRVRRDLEVVVEGFVVSGAGADAGGGSAAIGSSIVAMLCLASQPALHPNRMFNLESGSYAIHYTPRFSIM